ncbi:uncharacterized protein LOC111693349 [Trichogramma pretiosum]|uniref:uncharacterized protein LOC111693349 n=1 Tax=Trichogramma pretiosum TaxID=7493 RepID=UPI000C71B2EF|nr:uncharacterized protein LOC111693349 [Trichogramma pretiosum]
MPISRLPTKMWSSTIIEEIQSEIKGNMKNNEHRLRNGEGMRIQPSLPQTKDNKAILCSTSPNKAGKLPVRSFPGYHNRESNGHSKQSPQIEKRIPLLAKIKPTSAIKQKI